VIYDHPSIRFIYRHSPVTAQHLLVSIYGGIKVYERWGSTFQGYVRELEQSSRLSAQELRSLQAERLRRLVRHSYESVPYYRRVFDERKLKPEDIRGADDLYKLPVLTKQDVRNHYDELRSRVVSSSTVTVAHTGGSTGVPLQFLLDRNRVIFDHALTHRQWSWAGFRPRDRVAILRGLTLIPAENRSGCYWRHDLADRRLYLSSFHLSKAIMPLYVRKLQRWQPKFIAGYPSSLYTLARYLEQVGVTVPVTAVFTSSEVLTNAERRVIERRFGCRVWDRYGTGERLAVAQQCEYGSYHESIEFGVLQVDSPRGQPAPQGGSGELIHTGLTNFSMPLIRYASEDVSRLLPDARCSCGRSLPVMAPVLGRKDDVIVTADGRRLPGAGLTLIHEFLDSIERCQLVQEHVGEVIVKVQPRSDFGPSDSAELERELRRRLGDAMKVKIELVDSLEVTITGKSRFIVSRIHPNDTGVPAAADCI
jgi:phenylacetate-CoA ligase